MLKAVKSNVESLSETEKDGEREREKVGVRQRTSYNFFTNVYKC